MPIGLEENELLIRCSCHSREHLAYLIHEPDANRGYAMKGEEDDWYLSVMLDHFSFWKRARKALVYLFAPHRIRYGMAAEIVLRNEDVDKIAEFICRRRHIIVDAAGRVS